MMHYGEDPQVVEMAGLLATAIGQRLQAELGVQFRHKVKADLDSYIIEFSAEVPGANPARRWAAEMRGQFHTLLNSAIVWRADEIVAAQAAEFVGMWRKDNAATQAGVPQ